MFCIFSPATFLLSFFDDAECTYLKIMMLSYVIQNGGAHANPDDKRSALEISVPFFFFGTLTNATLPPSLPSVLLYRSSLCFRPYVCLLTKTISGLTL
jgi:hypothetical protein